jgi:hypothetical protein
MDGDMDEMQLGAQSAYVVEEPNDEELRRMAVLNALGSTLAAKRRDFVSARVSSGIEDLWQADSEFYEGYDDANRHEFVNNASKPLTGNSLNGSTANGDRVASKGSTVFPNITQPYVDAAAARVGDMLLPTDDRNFALEPTPLPEMYEGLERLLNKAGVPTEAQQMPALPAPGQQAPQVGMPQDQASGAPNVPGAPPSPGAAPAPAQPQQPPQMVSIGGQIMSVADAKAEFDAQKKEAARKAKKAEDQVDDWLVECQYHAEMRKVIDDAAKLGSGVIKGPVPVMRKSREWRQDPETGAYEYILIEEIKPASHRVDPWDLFPDPGCGENIHAGTGIFERDRLTPKLLQELRDVPGYISGAIDMCLREGPMRQQEADARNLFNNAFAAKNQFEIWYFHGDITAEELRAAGCDVGDAPNEASVPAMITMVNDRVVKASLNPLDDGSFPYDVIPWKRRQGMPWGMGVARQMRTPQRIVVAATRNLMDNAGLAAGPQIVLRRGVRPEDGVYEIVPLKLWEEEDDTGSGATSSPVTSVVIPMLQVELMAIIQMGMKMAEDVTGMPMLLQGQQGSAPDTVGGLVMLDNNANAVLRRLARLFDSSITEPHVRRYYTWLMEYGDNDDAKGDFQIVARGSSALVERSIQNQEMVQILQLCLNPAYGKNPAKAMDEYLKSRRFDPATFDYSEEEKQKQAEAAQNQPPDPRIQAAQIAAESNEKIAGIREQGGQGKQQAQQQFLAGENDKNRQLALVLKELDAQQVQFKEQNGREMTDSEIKASLAESVMKIRSQERLSLMTTAAGTATKYSVSPAVEPSGVAPVGQGFQR